MSNRLQGKIAIVTGAGSGFGEGISKAFCREGAKVILADINRNDGRRVEKEIRSSGGDAVFMEFDCTKRAYWDNGLEFAKEHYGGLDIVVNNAGNTHSKKPTIEVTEDDFDMIMGLNCKSIFLSVIAIMPYFVEKKGGQFIMTSSVAAMMMVQGLAAEYGPMGIRVNAICPLRGNTGMLERASGVPDTPEERARFAKTVPLGRMSEPEDIANAYVFVASDEAKFITGAQIPVDGGRLCV